MQERQMAKRWFLSSCQNFRKMRSRIFINCRKTEVIFRNAILVFLPREFDRNTVNIIEKYIEDEKYLSNIYQKKHGKYILFLLVFSCGEKAVIQIAKIVSHKIKQHQ